MKKAKLYVLMDGDVSQRSLRLASAYGHMLYVISTSNENEQVNACT